MKQADEESRRHFLKLSSMLGLAVAFSPGTIAETFADSKPRTTKRENIMTQPTATGTEQAADKTAIRPFQFNFSDAELTDLRRRVNATRWPERESVGDASQGVQLATMQKLARYWGTDYDWRKGEGKLKAVPHFITEIDGLDIHFIHVRSKHENALPMIVTHGWPGSIIEQMKIIEPLTNPTAHGGTAEDAFHLVIPSSRTFGSGSTPKWEGMVDRRCSYGKRRLLCGSRAEGVEGANRTSGQAFWKPLIRGRPAGNSAGQKQTALLMGTSHSHTRRDAATVGDGRTASSRV
jgi:hypothetical protein